MNHKSVRFDGKYVKFYQINLVPPQPPPLELDGFIHFIALSMILQMILLDETFFLVIVTLGHDFENNYLATFVMLWLSATVIWVCK